MSIFGLGLDPGDMVHYVKNERLQTSKIKGEHERSYAHWKYAFCKIEQGGGGMTDMAGADTAVGQVKFTIHYDREIAELNPKNYETIRMTLERSGRNQTFYPVHISEYETYNRTITITAERVR